MSEKICAQIAARLTPQQAKSREAIERECCGNQRCWDANDLDGYLMPGCKRCWNMATLVEVLLGAREVTP